MTWHDPFQVIEPISFSLLYTEHIHVFHAVPLLCLFIHEAYSLVLLPGTGLVWFDLISLAPLFLHAVEQNNFPEPGIINWYSISLLISDFAAVTPKFRKEWWNKSEALSIWCHSLEPPFSSQSSWRFKNVALNLLYRPSILTTFPKGCGMLYKIY